jgi:hypothetical protein
MSHHGGHGYPITKQMKIERRKRAEEQQSAYETAHPTLQSKLDALPAGGANKQRARLQALLLKKSQPKQEPAVVQGELQVVIADTSPKQKQQKKYMKGAK